MDPATIGKRALVSTQGAEVFSVRIRSHTSNMFLRPHNSKMMCGIFGTIYVKDDIPADDNLCIYSRGSTDLDYICSSSGTSLSLLSTPRPIVPTKLLRLVFDLKNEDGDEFIKGSYNLDTYTLDSYDQCLSIDCIGSLGLATVCYSVLSVALPAKISISLVDASGEAEIIERGQRGLGGPNPHEVNNVEETKVEETKVEEPKVIEGGLRYYGSVVAYYKKNFKSPTKKDEKYHWRIMLLNITKDHCLLRNGEIPLSRSRVTVPAYSSLVVKVKLVAVDSMGEEHRKYRVRGKLVYEATNFDNPTKVLRKLHQSLCVTVDWDRDEMPFLEVRPEKFFCSGSMLTDVSSVRIVINQNFDDKRDIEVYGSVRALDGDDMALFSHEKNNSVRLFSDDVLPMDGLPRCIMGSHFDILLSLKEKSQDLEVCHGYWDLYLGCDWRLYETRLAAFIEGKDGYAVMHFTIYASAVQALMEAKLCVDTYAAIYGSIVARIENNEHAGEYVKKYFQKRLFDVPEANPVMLKPNCESGQPARKQILLPLVIDPMAVPGDCPLIIEANLAYKTELSKEWVKMESLMKFNPYSSGESEFHIGEKDGGIVGRIGWFSSPWHTRTLCKFNTKEEALCPPEDKGSF